MLGQLNDAAVLRKLESAPDDFSDGELWSLLDHEWSITTPLSRLAAAGYRLLDLYDISHRPALVGAALGLLWDAYEREPAEHDPDLVVCLGNCLLFLAPKLRQPELFDEAILRLEITASLNPRRSDIWTCLAKNFGGRYSISNADGDIAEAVGAARKALHFSSRQDMPLHANDLSNYLVQLADTGQPDLLDEAFTLMLRACRTARPSNPNWAAFLLNRAVASRRLADRDMDLRQARMAVRYATSAAMKLPKEAHAWQLLAEAHLTAYDTSPRSSHLHAAASAGQRALATSSRYQKAQSHHLLSRIAQIQLERTFAVSWLEEALRHAKTAVRVSGGIRGCSSTLLINLAVCLSRYSELSGRSEASRRAVNLARLASSRATGVDEAICRGQLATILLGNYERNGRLGDLTSAITELRAVEVSRPTDVIARLNLSQALLSLHDRTQAVAALEDARTAVNEARQLISNDSTLEPVLLSLEASLSHADFDQSGSIEHLSTSITMSDAAIKATPVGSADYPTLCHDAGLVYRIRYERQGNPSDLRRALTLTSTAAEKSLDGTHTKSAALAQLAAAQRCLFERTGDRTALDEALNSSQAAVAIHSGFSQWANLAACQLSQFEVTGELEQLNTAIISARQAAQWKANVTHGAAHTNLANALLTRFEFLGDLNDLDEAVTQARQALLLTPQTSMWLAGRLSNYANALRAKAEVSQNSSMRRKAIRLHEQACAIPAAQQPEKSSFLSNWALALADDHDFQGAVEKLRLASAIAPRPARRTLRANLAMALRELSQNTGSASALNEAIQILRSVTRPSSSKSPAEARQLALGNALYQRYLTRTRASDLQGARQAWEQAIADLNSVSSHRLMAAESLAYSYTANEEWHGALTAFHQALQLLPGLAWHGLDWASREAHLARRPPLGSMACASALQTGNSAAAVEMVEAGRGIMWRDITWKQALSGSLLTGWD